MVGIIGALEEEVVMFKHDMEVKKTEVIAKCEYVSGILNGQEVVITRCGMGKVNAASCASIMIERYKPDFIINTGVGGSLDKSLKILDIMIAEDVVQHDYNVVPLGGFLLGQVDNFDSPFFVCDERISKAIKDSTDKFGYPSQFCRFATGDKFIEKPEDKDFIIKNFGAKVCDMESGAIAQICTLNGVRFANIRTVSDSSTGDDTAMEFHQFLRLASTHSVFVIEDIIEHVENVL